MATTTATLTLSSDMLSSPISISASSTLMKAGLTEGLELIEMGRGTIAEADGSKTAEFGLATAGGNDKAAKLFLVNKATDPTYYIDVDIHDAPLGRLYAGILSVISLVIFIAAVVAIFIYLFIYYE